MAATAPARETYLKTHFDVWPGPTLSGSDSIGDGYSLTYLCYFTHFYDFEGKSSEKIEFFRGMNYECCFAKDNCV